MNWLDIVLIAILAGSSILGLVKGFTRAIIGVASIVAAVLLSLWFYGWVGGFFAPYVSSRAISNLIGFLIVFFAVTLCGSLLAAMVARLLRASRLSWLDRLFGFAFGAARGLLLAVVLVMGLITFDPKPPAESVAESRVAPWVGAAAAAVSEMAPREIRDAFATGYRYVRRIWEDATGNRTVQHLPAERL